MTSTSHTKQRRLLVSCTGAFITHIPYRGSAPALQDVMAGQVDFVFDSGIAFPHIKAGKVKLLGVASDQAHPPRDPVLGWWADREGRRAGTGVGERPPCATADGVMPGLATRIVPAMSAGNAKSG